MKANIYMPLNSFARWDYPKYYFKNPPKLWSVFTSNKCINFIAIAFHNSENLDSRTYLEFINLQYLYVFK